VEELNTTIDIKENKEIEMDISFRFSDRVKDVYFSIPYPIRGLEVEGGICKVDEYINNILVCSPSSPFAVGQIIIDVHFTTEGMIRSADNKTVFSLDIPLLQDVDKMNIVVELPELMVLSNEDLLPLSPSNADIISDGRKITLNWNLRENFKGDIISLRIYYENLNPVNFIQLINPIWVIVLLLVIVAGFYLIYRRISKRSSIVLSVLNEAERIIVNIIQENGGEDVDQRKLVRSSGFSKAKVSRIVQSLEARGVVSVQRIGRKNKLTLKKKFVKEDAEQ
jgi:predicted transcriptional regulator